MHSKIHIIITTLVLVLSLLFPGLAHAATYLLQGRVTDTTGVAIPYATVGISPSGASTLTDAEGRFNIHTEGGKIKISVSFVGYKSYHQTFTITANKKINISLIQTEKELREVVVTAQENRGLSTGSRINRDAMAHLQPTSFSDLLELLPGNMSKTPNMGSVNSIQLRETGPMTATGQKYTSSNYTVSSLGTLFVVDGAPLQTEANMQNIPLSSSYSTVDAGKDATNRGVDMRSISTDNIESVEIVRGIPGVEYGNLTSGLVNIKRIRRATPLTARFKADEYSKLVSVGKGFTLPGTKQIVNLDAGVLDSKVDPRNNLENYKRINLSARGNLKFNHHSAAHVWILGMDYTGSFDNAKTDPDLTYGKTDEYRSSYNRYAITSDWTSWFKRMQWLRSINLNTSVSYQVDNLERQKMVAPLRASISPTSMEAGIHDGHYLLGQYVAQYRSEGRPLSAFIKLKIDGKFDLSNSEHKWMIGSDFTLTKNYGRGQIYDLTKPLAAAWVTRPRAYKDIPALDVLSYYAEDLITLPLLTAKLELQAGVRALTMTNLPGNYAMHGKHYFDPRINAKISLPAWDEGRIEIYLAGGYGKTTKFPTADYLFPQVEYSDFIRLNYYDPLNPLEHSRVSLHTFIDDRSNPNLGPARNTKAEMRLGGTLYGTNFSVTYFNEKMRSGFRYSALYRPYSFQQLDASAIDPRTLTGPPDIDNLPYTQINELAGYSTPANGSRIDKQGIEWTITSPRISPIHTALTVTGAWFRSTYSNSQKLLIPVNDVVGQIAVSRKYIGLYDTNDGRVNEQLNTNFMFDTQIPRWGLIFSTNFQCMWFTSTTKLRQNGTPDMYLDVADGQYHPYTEASLQDVMLQFLRVSYNEGLYKKQTTPIAMYVNLKATKQIGRWLKVAVFANRIIDYLPDYKSNGLTLRRISSPYFGMELNFTL